MFDKALTQLYRGVKATLKHFVKLQGRHTPHIPLLVKL